MKNQNIDFIDACKEEPTLVFTLIKQGNYEVVEELINENLINVNIVDSVGNDVVTRLLKAQQYDLVCQLMKKRNWNVNHQNADGNTFAHVLANDDSLFTVKIAEQLIKKKNYIPYIKNKKGETALDRSINNNYICTAFKLLADKKYNNIDAILFRNLFNTCIKNKYYGKYSKINNLEIIVENLEKKDLSPSLRHIVDNISDNMDLIKNDIMNNKHSILDTIIDSFTEEINV